MASFSRFGARAVRKTARIPCQVVRLSDFRLVADVVENLSDAGLLVGPADPVLTGQPVMVSFQLPGFRDFVDAEAIVARVVHGRRPGEIRRALGLEFVDISGESRKLLEAFLRHLVPTPPRYRIGIKQPVNWLRVARATV